MVSVVRERFVGIDEVATHMGKPVSWIYNNAERLDLPRYRIGNHWRYRLSEVDDWILAGGGARSVSSTNLGGVWRASSGNRW